MACIDGLGGFFALQISSRSAVLLSVRRVQNFP